jgi:flagellar motor switch protein FliM
MTAGEVLSQDEVERLLNMMSGTTPEPKPDEYQERDQCGGFEKTLSMKRRDETLNAVKQMLVGKNEENPVPERIDKTLLKSLQRMHEQLAQRFAARVCAMLQSVVEVRLTNIDQLAYSEFIFGLDNPICFNVLQVKSPYASENMFLDVNTSICCPMIERMLGGGREPAMPRRRPLTNIELRLIQQIIDVFLNELKDTWKKIVELEFTIEQTESNPMFVQVVAPNEEMVIMCFEVSVAEIRGTMTLCIPVDVLKRLHSVGQSGHEDVVMEVFRKTSGISKPGTNNE